MSSGKRLVFGISITLFLGLVFVSGYVLGMNKVKMDLLTSNLDMSTIFQCYSKIQ